MSCFLRLIFIPCVHLFSSCDRGEIGTDEDTRLRESDLLQQARVPLDVPELCISKGERFWKDKASIGNSIKQGGKIFHRIDYHNMSEKTKRELAKELRGYLRDPWIGQVEVIALGHVRLRDEAACIFADLIGITFPILPLEHPYDRDRRIAELIGNSEF